MFYKKELLKTNQKELRVEKVTKRKFNQLCVKWKGYDNSLNSWIGKKDIVKTSEYFLATVKVELDKCR